MKNIILLHGALGMTNDLQGLSLNLETLGFKCHLLNFSGHGDKDFKSEFGIAQFSIELKDFILSHQLEGASVFGYSMGGYVALYLATQMQGLMANIITLGTKFNWTGEVIKRESGMCDEHFLSEKAPGFLSSLNNKHANTSKLLDKSKGMIEAFAKENLLNDEILKSVACPVMLGRGDQDRMVTMEETVQVQTTIKNSALYVLPRTKHPLETVRTEMLALLIENFINQK